MFADADRMLLAWNRAHPDADRAPSPPSRTFTVQGKSYTLKPAACEFLQRRSAVLARQRMPAYRKEVDERLFQSIQAAY